MFCRKDYSGEYTVFLIPCTVQPTQPWIDPGDKPLSCTAHAPEKYEPQIVEIYEILQLVLKKSKIYGSKIKAFKCLKSMKKCKLAFKIINCMS